MQRFFEPVTYCMYGFWISQDTVAALPERGYDAHISRGDISAWRAMSYPTEPLLSYASFAEEILIWPPRNRYFTNIPTTKSP